MRRIVICRVIMEIIRMKNVGKNKGSKQNNYFIMIVFVTKGNFISSVSNVYFTVTGQKAEFKPAQRLAIELQGRIVRLNNNMLVGHLIILVL